jgi:hypothetical protein
MSRRRKIIGFVGVVILAVVVWVASQIAITVRRIPEAYAAWDTGTLLVEYLKTHDDQWPTSWDDLLTVLAEDSSDEIVLWGAGADDLEYAQGLREIVAVDWTIDAADVLNTSPVTRLNGRAFSIVWENAEPNEMVRE